ncbi:F-box domain containing protein, partial [Tanacetum coccineum]
LPSSLMVDDVKFKSLKMLSLSRVPIDEDIIKRLTTSCPLLEELNVKDCYGFKTFCVYGVPNLKKLAFYYKHAVEIIDIEAPNLYACDLFLRDSEGRDAPCMNLSSCKELRTLHLRGYLFPISEGLGDLLSSFPFLENLFFEPYKCKSIKLSSHSLRTLVLISECDLEEMDMNMPNLLLFDYRGHSQNLGSLVRRPGPLKPRMECYPDDGVNIIWFEKLRRFLDKCVRFSEFKLHISEMLYLKLKEQGFIRAWKLKVIPPFELEHVELGSDNMQDSSHYVNLVDAILWCFRPRSLTLELKFHCAKVEEWSHIVEFTLEKLLQQEDEGRKNIQIMLSSSSRDKKYFGDLNSLLTASPHDQQGETITFIKQEVNQEEGDRRTTNATTDGVSHMYTVEVNLRGTLVLGKRASIFVNILVSLAPPELTPSYPS